jgi:hypothetical protein
MLYALFTGERGLYLRDRYGDAVSQLAFDAPVQLGENSETVRIIPLLYSHPPPLHASSICSPAEDEMLTMWCGFAERSQRRLPSRVRRVRPRRKKDRGA